MKWQSGDGTKRNPLHVVAARFFFFMFGPKIVHQQRNASQLNARQTNWRPIPKAIHIVRIARVRRVHSNSPQAVVVVAKRRKYNLIADVARYISSCCRKSMARRMYEHKSKTFTYFHVPPISAASSYGTND